MTNKKAYLQISFAWIFAIIVGAFILFLAIFGVIKFISTEQTIQDAETGKEIGILLNPLETGFQTAQSSSMTLPVETQIYSKCRNTGIFGRQIIQISQKNFNKWTETNIDVGFSNKYIFSENPVQGKKFYLFSKPFNFPFKVTDLIYITSSEQEFCFVNPPEKIENEISKLKQANLLVNDCSEKSTRICFDSWKNCDTYVNYNLKYIEKNNSRIYFEQDALMFAGIFSDNTLYECHLQRIMQRTKHLAMLYKDKEFFISNLGCSSNLNLIALINSIDSFTDSSDLAQINHLAENIKSENEIMGCKLW